MKKTFTLLSFLAAGLAVSAQNHPITIHSTGRVASLEMSADEFKNWNDNDEFNNDEKRQLLVRDVYRKFNDDFDFIFLIYNNAVRPSNLTYAGLQVGVSNAVTGTGAGIFDFSASYGSAGKLKSIMALTHKNDLLNGPSLHELMHNWGNFNINTECHDPYGPGTGNFDFMPHWGISGCGGQLGGFDQSTLQVNVGGVPNKYSAGIHGFSTFGQFANGGNSVPYSNYELYLMGMIPEDSLTSFDVFRDITESDYTNGTFTANTRITYDKTKLIADFGKRVPGFDAAQKQFRLLVLVLTPTALTDNEWETFDTQVEQFTRPASDGTFLYNFWEATNGKGTLDAGNLGLSTGVASAGNGFFSGANVYPNPVKNKAGLSFHAAQQTDVTCELTDNSGRLILSRTIAAQKGANEAWLQLPELVNGIYFLRLTSPQGNMVKKISVVNE
jgi:hypothetical protein